MAAHERSIPFALGIVILLAASRLPQAFQPLRKVDRKSSCPDSTTGIPGSTALACQLLGMNSRAGLELNLRFVWPSFCERGGQTDVHADGWGLAYYHQGRHGLRQFHDVEAASTSPLAEFLSAPTSRIRTTNLMAHIRFATTGAVDLANVHPFSREYVLPQSRSFVATALDQRKTRSSKEWLFRLTHLYFDCFPSFSRMWGLNFAFCHNGHIPLMVDKPNHRLGVKIAREDERNDKGYYERFYSPIGTTDSEALFCAILNALRAQFVDTMPSLAVLHNFLQDLVHEVVKYDPSGTILNFLLTTGPHVLWVYSWPGRRPGSSTWNGLQYIVKNNSTSVLSDEDYRFDVMSLQDEDLSVSRVAAGVADSANSAARSSSSTAKDAGSPYCIVATKPLTDDPDWIELQPGELILMDNGLPHVSVRELFQVELRGHGLDNQGRAQIKPPRLEEDMRRFEFQPEFFSAGGI